MADELWTILKVLQWTHKRFAERGLGTPRLDAEVLLANLLGRDRVALYTHFDQPLADGELAAYRALIKRRLAGEPVAYLVGKQEFWSLSFAVDPRVLIPRPETEGLVEAVLKLVEGRPAPSVADIGTGSGAIAVALAQERPDARLVAVDSSADALAVARQNALTHGSVIEFFVGDLLGPLAGRGPFDVIVSNPPYVAEGDFSSLPAEVKREPRGALLAGVDGLDAIRRLVAGARAHLADAGVLALEVGAGQAQTVMELLREAGYRAIEVQNDLAGIARVVIGRA